MGLGPAIVVWFFGLIIFVILALISGATGIGFFATAAWIIVTVFNILSLGILLFGRFKRVGVCPHCATRVVIFNAENRAKRCRGCKRRLILRSARLHDVT
jgi:fumarate reductase subunit C